MLRDAVRSQDLIYSKKRGETQLMLFKVDSADRFEFPGYPEVRKLNKKNREHKKLKKNSFQLASHTGIGKTTQVGRPAKKKSREIDATYLKKIF